MKKSVIILLAAALVALPSCKNQNKAAKADEAISETSADLEMQALTVDMENLAASVSKMNLAPMFKKGEGVVLSDKEKLAKPECLLDPASVGELVTLTQKYRVLGILAADKAVAELYGMPTAMYTAAIEKLAAEVSDTALADYLFSSDPEVKGNISKLADAEYANGRSSYFWQAVSALLVEDLYVCTHKINTFTSLFTDETAADVTYNFVCVHEGISSLVSKEPEMQSLNEVLEPLYVINAINVDQLKAQLEELKGSISVVRSQLVK